MSRNDTPCSRDSGQRAPGPLILMLNEQELANPNGPVGTYWLSDCEIKFLALRCRSSSGTLTIVHAIQALWTTIKVTG